LAFPLEALLLELGGSSLLTAPPVEGRTRLACDVRTRLEPWVRRTCSWINPSLAVAHLFVADREALPVANVPNISEVYNSDFRQMINTDLGRGQAKNNGTIEIRAVSRLKLQSLALTNPNCIFQQPGA